MKLSKLLSVVVMTMLVGGWTASAAAASIVTVNVGSKTVFAGSNPFKVYFTSQPIVVKTSTPVTVPTTTNPPTTTTTTPSSSANLPTALTAFEQQMVNLVNQDRVKLGLKPLVVDMRLVKAARMKSQDLITKKYFAHNSPTYGSPFDMMKSMGISYRYAGENLAGAASVDRAYTNLMNSPGHRANILNPNYTKIGIGIVQGGPYGLMLTQMFIG